ncbi:MAG TPA: hypothetical protein VM165_07995, partial [Planctomycetaceae bacterium]|nr:hypothetical protein [Planctomycetaceae bacterium]
SGTPATPAAEEAAQPAITQAQATAPGTETDVQRELRRLYEESGREMPEVPTSIQTQRPLPAGNRAPAGSQPQPTAAQPLPPGPQGSASQPGGPAPAASAPAQKSGNPVTSFFKKLVPGGQSKPAVAAAPAAPTPSNPQAPAIARQATPKPPSNYQPYASQQPRRLPTTGAAPAQQAAVSPAPTTPGLPPSPTAAPAGTTHVTKASPPSAPVAKPAPVVQAIQPQVVAKPAESFFTEPEPAAAGDDNLVFEPPVVASPPAAAVVQSQPETLPANSEPAPLAISQPSEQSSATAIVAATPAEFPDPFPAMSEEDADDVNDEEFDTPFVGLTLDEEPVPTQAAPESIPETGPMVDPQPMPATTAAPALAVDAAAQPGAEASSGPALTLPAPAAAPELATPKGELSGNEPASVPKAQIVESSTTDQYAEKMKQIRDRGGMKGLKGFCPVTLRDERELKDSQPEFQSSFRGQKFHFTTADAKTKFDQDPARYAPAAYGADVVVLTRDKDVAEGSLDFAAWYKGNLYLFANEETYTTFITEPTKYASPAGLE